MCVWTDRFLGSEFLDGEVSLLKGFAAQFAYSVKLGLSSNRLLEGEGSLAIPVSKHGRCAMKFYSIPPGTRAAHDCGVLWLLR